MQVEIQDLTRVYGRGKTRTVAVRDVSWVAHGGEVLGLLGPNGSGKSTMLSVVLDILRPTEGQVLIDGQAGANSTYEFKQRVGYLPEERGLYRRDTALQAVSYLGALRGLDRKEARERAHWALDRVGLSEHKHKRIGALSKGLAQRAQLAAVIVHDPSMIVLDEPFSGLDPVSLRFVRDLVVELREEGKLIILATHRMDEVEALCDRIVLMHEGHMVLYGPIDQIMSKWGRRVTMDAQDKPEGLPAVESVHRTPHGTTVMLTEGATPEDLLMQMCASGLRVRRFRSHTSIEDVFVEIVRNPAEAA